MSKMNRSDFLQSKLLEEDDKIGQQLTTVPDVIR